MTKSTVSSACRRVPTTTACAAVLVALVGVATPSTAAPISNGVPNPPLSNYRLVFSDDFSTPSISPDHTGNYNWFEGYWFNSDHAPAGNISQKNNMASLTWTISQNKTVANTSISTFSKLSDHHNAWQFGYFEVRMRWQPVAGAWPAIWLASLEHATGQDVYSNALDGVEFGEIDIYETIYDASHKLKWPRAFYGTVWDWHGDPTLPLKPNWFSDSNLGNNERILPTTTDFSQFHTYALRWEPNRLSWYFDGRLLFSAPSYAVIDKQHYYLIIGMQAGVAGKDNWYPGVLPNPAPSKLTMDVAWVRVWQQN